MKISKEDVSDTLSFRTITMESLDETLNKYDKVLVNLTRSGKIKKSIIHHKEDYIFFSKKVRNTDDLMRVIDIDAPKLMKADDTHIDEIKELLQQKPAFLYSDTLTIRDHNLLILSKLAILRPLYITAYLHSVVRQVVVGSGGLEYPFTYFPHKWALENIVSESVLLPLKDYIRKVNTSPLTPHPGSALQADRDLLGDSIRDYLDLRVILEGLYRNAAETSAAYAMENKPIYESIMEVTVRDIKTNHYRGKKRYG